MDNLSPKNTGTPALLDDHRIRRRAKERRRGKGVGALRPLDEHSMPTRGEGGVDGCGDSYGRQRAATYDAFRNEMTLQDSCLI